MIGLNNEKIKEICQIRKASKSFGHHPDEVRRKDGVIVIGKNIENKDMPKLVLDIVKKDFLDAMKQRNIPDPIPEIKDTFQIPVFDKKSKEKEATLVKAAKAYCKFLEDAINNKAEIDKKQSAQVVFVQEVDVEDPPPAAEVAMAKVVSILKKVPERQETIVFARNDTPVVQKMSPVKIPVAAPIVTVDAAQEMPVAITMPSADESTMKLILTKVSEQEINDICKIKKTDKVSGVFDSYVNSVFRESKGGFIVISRGVPQKEMPGRVLDMVRTDFLDKFLGVNYTLIRELKCFDGICAIIQNDAFKRPVFDEKSKNKADALVRAAKNYCKFLQNSFEGLAQQAKKKQEITTVGSSQDTGSLSLEDMRAVLKKIESGFGQNTVLEMPPITVMPKSKNDSPVAKVFCAKLTDISSDDDFYRNENSSGKNPNIQKNGNPETPKKEEKNETVKNNPMPSGWRIAVDKVRHSPLWILAIVSIIGIPFFVVSVLRERNSQMAVDIVAQPATKISAKSLPSLNSSKPAPALVVTPGAVIAQSSEVVSEQKKITANKPELK